MNNLQIYVIIYRLSLYIFNFYFHFNFNQLILKDKKQNNPWRIFLYFLTFVNKYDNNIR